MLDDNMKTQLQGYLGRLVQPIELVPTLDASDAAQELRTLLAEIASLSPLVTVVDEDAGAGPAPSFSIRPAGGQSRVRFAGLPMGHEFTSLVLALLQVGGYPPKVEPALIEQIRALEGEFTFETFISLSCQNCPDVVQALNLMAVLNPRIRHTMIDGALFQDEVGRRQVMAVPAVFLNGAPFGQGRMALEEIVAKLDAGAAERETRKMNDKTPFDVLVVGGGPAGAAAAIYAARKGIRTGLAAERFGGQVLDTVGIENFISVPHTEGPRLASALEQHVRSYEVDVMNLQRAEALVPGELIEVRFKGGGSLLYAPLGRRLVARDERAGREHVPQPRRRVLPALRRAALQGQAGGRDRWRQLRRRGGDRPRGHRQSRHPDRVRLDAARRRRADPQAP